VSEVPEEASQRFMLEIILEAHETWREAPQQEHACYGAGGGHGSS
jgi:hypothetical protein